MTNKSSKPKNSKAGQQKSKPAPASTGKNFLIELAKHEVLTLVGKGLWSLIQNLPLVIAFILTLKDVWESFVSSTAPYMVLHPWRTFLVILLLVAITPVARGAIRTLVKIVIQLFATHHAPTTNVEVHNELKSTDLALIAGLKGFSQHFTKKDKRLDWEECREKIKSAKDLRIMGANGWDTFGDPSAPLHKTLKAFKGDLKILLLKDSPNLNAIVERTQDLDRNPVSYVEQIKNSLAFLAKLKSDNPSRQIEVRLYETSLNWKMIICNEYMWLQHYWAERDIEDTPVYTFFSDGGKAPSSLFHPFHGEWKKQWGLATPYAL